MLKFIRLVVVLLAVIYSRQSWGFTTNGFCQKFQLVDIPVGDFRPPLHLPESILRVTQGYNTSKAEGYCLSGKLQPDGNSPACAGKKIYFGHDGLDMHPQGAPAGQVDIHSVFKGLVVASHSSGSFGGWGESLIIATRPNLWSEEILTLHYHHLYFNSTLKTTSRLFGPCEQVESNQVIAKEGGTPDWPTHLHLSVKRWKNLRELQDKINLAPTLFYGFGYTFGVDSKITNFLDPQGLLLDTFDEFQSQSGQYSGWEWSYPYIRGVRSHGWDFGNFDGSFGVATNVTRREAARWIKQAMQLSGTLPVVNHFQDIPLTDNDSPYIEALVSQNVTLPVINPTHSCTSVGVNFCPDQSLTRAEALKMVVTAFYQDQFIELYNNWVWRSAAPLADNLLSRFVDVSANSWYAPYLYFAWQQGLTGGGVVFQPNLPIKRAELAKWLVMGYEHLYGQNPYFCQSLECSPGYYCSGESANCELIPGCLPTENSPCPLGGGYNSQNQQEQGAASSAGGSTSSGSETSPSACSPGQDQLQICPDGQTASYRVCLSTAQWSDWNPPCPTGSSGQSSGAGGTEGTGEGGAGGSGSTTGSGGSQCLPSLQLSPAGASCYSNPAGSGSPTLCLETQSPSGGQLSWRLCKQNSSFQSAFTYQLLDQNHLSQFLGDQRNGSPGQSCTGWVTSDFSYINKNGPINGAGLVIEVHSPSGCASTGCTYYSGLTTLYRACL